MQERAAVMLSDSREGTSVAANLSRRSCRVASYTSLEQLLDEHPPGSIPVLIFHLHERPKGDLLVVIGRLAVEHPGIQKVAVTETPLPLEVAGYLTACDVDLVPMEPDGQDAVQLASVVTRMHERRERCLAAG
jgi:hypothetical protein